MPVESEPTPEALIAAVARGDRHAFAQLFERFSPRIKTYLIRRGCDAAQADELAQDAMLSVWRKASLFDPGRTAAGWIFAIARNLRIDALRRMQTAANAIAMPEVPEASAMPDQQLVGEQAAARLRLAMADLPAEQIQVVTAAYFGDLSQSEVASALGLPLGTVKSRLRLAIQRLRTALEGLQ